MKKQRFKLKKEHVALLREFKITWGGPIETTLDGAPQIDQKRPFGNSNILLSMCEILKVEYNEDEPEPVAPEQEEWLWDMYKELTVALQVVLAAGSFKPGIYEADEYDTNWRLKK